MSRLIIAYELNEKFRQIHIEGGFTFDHSGRFTAYLRDSAHKVVKIPLAGKQPFPVFEPGNKGYVEGFRSITNLAACNAVVPAGTTVVVIEGAQGENATIFRGDGVVIAVRNNGKSRVVLLGKNSGDSNTKQRFDS